MTPCYCGMLGGLLCLGGFLIFSLTQAYVRAFLTWTLDLTVFNTPPGSGSGIVTRRCACVVFVSQFTVMLLPVYVSAHPAVHVNGANRAM